MTEGFKRAVIEGLYLRLASGILRSRSYRQFIVYELTNVLSMAMEKGDRNGNN